MMTSQHRAVYIHPTSPFSDAVLRSLMRRSYLAGGFRASEGSADEMHAEVARLYLRNVVLHGHHVLTGGIQEDTRGWGFKDLNPGLTGSCPDTGTITSKKKRLPSAG